MDNLTPSEVIARAKAFDLLVAGQKYTLADLRALVAEAEDALGGYGDPDEDGEKAYLRFLEGGWDVHGTRFRDEAFEAQLLSPFAHA